MAAEAVDGGEAVAIPSLGSVVGSLAALLGQGRSVTLESAKLAADLAKIAVGRADFKPVPGDRRFEHPTWRENPFYRRLAGVYLAWSAAMNRLLDDMDRNGSDWHSVERARFATAILVSALAPTNTLWGNPAAIKRAFDTGGTSLWRGFQNWLDDLRHNGGMPSQIKQGVFEVGRDLAITPGSVVQRDEVAELLQYRPTTQRVRVRPILIVPPPIGRYYFLDLRPGRSFVEYAVSRGLNTFMLSWRNPTPKQAHWDMETYASRILSAIDAVREVSGSDDINLIGFCAGGIMATTVLNHLAASRDQRVHSMSYAVTLLDFSVRAPIGTFSSSAILNLARARSSRDGIISAKSMGAVFTWMRPDDLVFNYWVNNYLMGEPPPAFDILAWSVDGTNLSAALHKQFLDIFAFNTLCQPGALKVLGTPLDLSRINLPMFVTGATTDHLTPWKGCYQTTQLLKGQSTFVLSNAGHIASLVNPPGNPKATYRSGPPPGSDPEIWLRASEQHSGSWWEVWADWVLERSGHERDASPEVGSATHPALDPAPGLYVRDQVPKARHAATASRTRRKQGHHISSPPLTAKTAPVM
jgi:polyhydroxyalkanoate synthase